MQATEEEAKTGAFGRRLREMRSAAGLTLEEVAERAGVNVATVWRIEAGRHDPQWEVALALAGALGVGVGAFTAGSRATARRKGPARLPASKLRAWREGRKLTMRQAGERVGISKQRWQVYEASETLSREQFARLTGPCLSGQDPSGEGA